VSSQRTRVASFFATVSLIALVGCSSPDTGELDLGRSSDDLAASSDLLVGDDLRIPADLTPAGDLAMPADQSVLKKELDLCTTDGDCAAPLVCRPFVKNGASRCTRTCTPTVGCLAGERCLIDAMSTQTCIGEDIGRGCNTTADCNFGCLTSQHTCTAPCTTGSDCPNGWGCMAVGSPAQRLCVQYEAPCTSTDTSACIQDAFCDLSSGLILGGCTGSCATDSDCPQRAAGAAKWSCDASSGICRRPPDVFGSFAQATTPAQYACNGAGEIVNLCNDARHIDFAQLTQPTPPAVSCSTSTPVAGSAGDACVDSCLYQGGCVYGFACTAVGSLGSNRIGLCVPSLGTGEVGAHCATDGDCVFGYCLRSTSTCSRDCTYDGVCPSGSTCTAGGGSSVEGVPFRNCQ